jgi:hypothetical protein
MVTAVETWASVVALALADANSDGGQNRVSGGSSGNSGYGSGREAAGAGNNQQNVAAVAAETVVMAAAIVAARLQLQAGWRRGRRDNGEGSCNSNNSRGEFIPLKAAT